MIIRDMFEKDINRKINGVVQVEQDEEDVIYQEVDEYVVTKELKKHFMSFFDVYVEAFSEPTQDIGVWISGFFGSGKSHFLKMLAYILENRTVKGVKTVELFRKKFDGDPGAFMPIESSARHETETILFNIDVEGPANKDKTAVLRVFAKMFYDHLGYYGDNLKVVRMEQYVASQGKTEEFRRAFAEKGHGAWEDRRKAFNFNREAVVYALMKSLDITEEDACRWFNDKSETEFSVSDFVKDIKAYVDTKPADFRLIFMADEVGQYIGSDTSMLLNLQSLVEELGRVCRGKAWVVCTGQEAIDEIVIKLRTDEFSRIQARFVTRLSLSSSSVDEVIQERLLKKTPGAEKDLRRLYDRNDATLRNLFSFTNARLDIKGYADDEEFAADFPFVPYQFIILQKAFEEIRKKGMSGKHQSGVERSMLEAFHRTVKDIQEKNECALAPFYKFYDTVHASLDGSVRRVIERCQRASDNGDGIEAYDVDVLKLLYLIRYVEDIPANLENLVIMMADDISVDKMALKAMVQASLDRLMDQNYIGRSGETYNFLTDEEQDVARDIKNTTVDTASIVARVGQMISGDIYTAKKFRLGDHDFSYDLWVDNMSIGTQTGGMRLRFLTVASDEIERDPLRLASESMGQAVVVLSEEPYFDSLVNASKIRGYVKQKNVSQLPGSMQAIIRERQEDAGKYESEARDELTKAIANASFYVDGEKRDIRSGDAKTKIDQALEYLVSHVYNKLNLITKNAQTDADIVSVLMCDENFIPGAEPNREAADDMQGYLETQSERRMPTSMADVQIHYQAAPYGWKEIDVAAVAAQLIHEQKVTIKYSGMTVRPDDARLPDMLRKKGETGKTNISVRVSLPSERLREARDFLRSYFDVMDVPGDEDGLVGYIIKAFDDQKDRYNKIYERYEDRRYPDEAAVKDAKALTDDVLSQQKDNTALIDRLLADREALKSNRDRMRQVEGFFRNQVKLFDEAVQMDKDLRNELGYLSKEKEAYEALNEIRLICMVGEDTEFDYKRIPELNGLMATVKDGHDRLLDAKRGDLYEIIRQCLEVIHTRGDDPSCKDIVTEYDEKYSQYKKRVKECGSLALLDGMRSPMFGDKDDALKKIDAVLSPFGQSESDEDAGRYATRYINTIFSAKRLKSERDVDRYLEDARATLLEILRDSDGIDLK